MDGMIEYWVYYKGQDDKFGIMGKFLKPELAELVAKALVTDGTVKEAWVETSFEPDTLEGD